MGTIDWLSDLHMQNTRGPLLHDRIEEKASIPSVHE